MVITELRYATAYLSCKTTAEFLEPTPHRLMADDDAPSMSSIMHRLIGDRKYSHTAWAITAPEKRRRGTSVSRSSGIAATTHVLSLGLQPDRAPAAQR